MFIEYNLSVQNCSNIKTALYIFSSLLYFDVVPRELNKSIKIF